MEKCSDEGKGVIKIEPLAVCVCAPDLKPKGDLKKRERADHSSDTAVVLSMIYEIQ